MTSFDLIARVRRHSGLDERHAQVALEAVLASLRGELGAPEVEALADALPNQFAEVLRSGRYAGSAAPDSVETQVAWRERVPVGAAREHLASVCRALAESLPAAALDRLLRAAPAIAPLLVGGSTAPPPALRAPAPRTSLAEGRPGSLHPLSESRTGGAQGNSVAAANPHGDTKLSSANGLTQERERASFATGRPGSSRPLSDGKE